MLILVHYFLWFDQIEKAYYSAYEIVDKDDNMTMNLVADVIHY